MAIRAKRSAVDLSYSSSVGPTSRRKQRDSTLLMKLPPKGFTVVGTISDDSRRKLLQEARIQQSIDQRDFMPIPRRNRDCERKPVCVAKRHDARRTTPATRANLGAASLCPRVAPIHESNATSETTSSMERLSKDLQDTVESAVPHPNLEAAMASGRREGSVLEARATVCQS